MKRILLVFTSAFLFSGILFAQTQEKGPLTPAPKKEIKRLPVESAPEPPPIPVEEIVKRFTENEMELLRIRNGATYRVSVRLQEFDDKSDTPGEYRVVREVGFSPEGKPIEKTIDRQSSTLKYLDLAPEDLQGLGHFPAFMLPTPLLKDYEVTYAGIQPVDELNTFVFKVRPRQISRTRKFFEGVIWVDDKDFAIVKTYGQYVSEVESTSEPLPFQIVETFREYVAQKYWLPSYIRTEGVLKKDKDEIRIRLTVRFTDYKPPAPQ